MGGDGIVKSNVEMESETVEFMLTPSSFHAATLKTYAVLGLRFKTVYSVALVAVLIVITAEVGLLARYA